MEAAIHGSEGSDFNQIRILLEGGAPVNEPMQGGYTPLSAVILHKNTVPEEKLKIVKLLLKYKADPLALSPTCSTEKPPIDSHHCVEIMLQDCEEYKKDNIAAGIHRYFASKQRESLAGNDFTSQLEGFTLKQNNFEEVEKVYQNIESLLQVQVQKQERQKIIKEQEAVAKKIKQLSPNQELLQEMSRFEEALNSKPRANKNCHDLMGLINESNCNLATPEGFTPLHFVAAFGNLDQMRKLINFSANINATTPKEQISVLRCAVTSSNSQGNVRVLLEREDLTAENICDGVSAAITFKKDAVVKDILKPSVTIKKIDSVEFARGFVSKWREGIKGIGEEGKKRNCSAAINVFEQEILTKFSTTKRSKKSKMAATEAVELVTQSEIDSAELVGEAKKDFAENVVLASEVSQSEEDPWEEIRKALAATTQEDLKVESEPTEEELQRSSELSTNATRNSELSANATPFVPNKSLQNSSQNSLRNLVGSNSNSHTRK